MNPTFHLRHFLEKATTDKTMKPSHLAVYMTLFQLWSANQYKNPISISRVEIMKSSKIKSTATYHKCLKNLNDLGYLKYTPSFHPIRGSHVLLHNWPQVGKKLNSIV
jgi:hypothetical protein